LEIPLPGSSRSRSRFRSSGFLCIALLIFQSPLFAQVEPAPVLEEILIWGRATQLLGSADSASQGVVGYDDFSTRPLSRVAELVEVIPGMIATQHSGPGKANQYFLRGINLDHGSDFSNSFDGMPINFRTHGHAQGYLDLNFIIPEIIERVDYRKGPYYADAGDFSLAGSNAFKTYDELEDSFSELILGNDEELRFVTAGSFGFADGTLLYAFEHEQTNGPFVLDQDVRKVNGLVKYTGSIGGVRSQITAMAYDSEWISTNQVPQRAVDSGLIGRFGFIDPDLGGESHRYSITGTFDFTDWQLNTYASRYYMSLINNPTYFLNDPINGDEFEQEDERWVAGGSLRNEVEVELFGIPTTRTLGADLRFDDVGELNLFTTVDRRRTGSIREDQVEELSLDAFAQWEMRFTERLRGTLGVRVDYYDFDVKAKTRDNSGSGNDSLWQPNVGLAYLLTDHLELYANYGHGFHSNDVRGAVITTDPLSGDPVDQLPVLVEGKGSEVGFRYDNLDGFIVSLAAFELKMDSELVFVGDAGTTEPSDGTRRQGVEVAAFWEITEGLVVDLTAAKTDGHFLGRPSGEDNITDAHEQVSGAGITLVRGGFTGSLRMRYFSDAALTEDASVKKDDSSILNLGLAYDFGDWNLGLDVLNLTDAEDDDIAYFFESRLPGETAGVEDIHFHPSNPRTYRVTLRYEF
jgi:outer membrane receptor protein involved in Fe transport